MDIRSLLVAALLGTTTAAASGAASSTAAAQDAPDRTEPRRDEFRDEHGRRCWQSGGPVVRTGPTWTCEDAQGNRERVRVRPRARGEAAGSR